MKKNNKGFTLIELLAALVILGVLAVISIPTVVNMMSNSRDKLYVTDAKKLISQAEYKLRVASSELEKPEDGECLIISMVYLDNSDFDNSPNNGEYVREASYVVVKNDGGNFEFSVELVEEIKKNVFKGVELSKDSNLTTSSTRHVVAFKKDDLNFVENNTVMGKYNGKQVDTSYINSKLGGSYVSGISKVYNYPDLADSTYNANYSIPKIVRAEYMSASNKNFNSLDAILKVVATDVDTPTSDLVVYVGSGREGRYPDIASAVDCDANMPYEFRECKYDYGNLSDFSLKVDFSQDGYNYSGDTASLYIMVMDKEGNSDRLNPSYKIHTNEAPVIDTSKSGIFKRNSDAVNLSTAVLKLFVSDDSTPSNELEYCITENKDATTCTNYQPYSNFNNSELTYTFSCGNDCSYDGSTLHLKVFLRDNDPKRALETTAVFSYKLFQNDVPKITQISLTSEALPFVTAESKALKTDVKLTIEDSSSSSNLTVILDEDASFSKNPVSYKYSDFNGNVSYTFSGLYDGEERVLHVKVIDEYNSVGTASKKYGTVHRNSPPVIEEIVTTSADLLEEVCPNSKICDKYSNNGGAYKLVVDITASDDLVADEDLMVCISATQSDCTNVNSGNFLLYNSGKSKELILPRTAIAGSYDGLPRTIYVSVYDGYGVAIDNTYNYSTYGDSTKEYKIYKNHPPEINEDELTIVSTDIDYNLKNVIVKFKVNDDLDSINTLTYKLYDNAGGAVKTGTIPATSPDTLNEITYTFGGDYDGENRILTIEVMDSYNAVAKVTKEYEIHENEAPNISYATVESVGKPCLSDVCDNGNSLDTKIKFNVTDDLDSSMPDLQLCVSESSTSCTDYKAIKNYDGYTNSNNEFTISYTIPRTDYPYNGETKTIYLYVKDSYGAVNSKTTTYTVYNNTKAVIDGDYPIVRSSNYEELMVEISEGEIYYTNKNPNISTINFSLKASDEFIESKDLKYQICYADSVDVNIKDSSQITCLENGKFYDYGTSDVSTQAVDLGVTSYEGQEFFMFAKVYDDYAYACATDSSKCNPQDNYISYSSMVYYQVYKDIDPEITKFVVSRPENTTSYEKLNITFSVYDKLDTFTYCISEVEDTCTNYSTTKYSGDTREEVTVTYNPTWGSSYTQGEDRVFLLYLYVKDRQGKISGVSTFPERIPCEVIIDDTGKVTDEGSVQDSIIYELKSGSQELTATKCGYKCYYWDQAVINGTTVGPSDTADIVAYYKRTVTFLDRDDRSIICNKDVDENYEAHCNFKTCYYNSTSNNYQITAIGYMKHDNSDSSYSHTEGKDTHVPSYYRNEYTTDYDSTSDMITLHPTGNKICGQCFDEGKYSTIVITYDNNE